MKRLGFALFLLIALESCDAINRVEGIVYSASTNLPIEGAIVEMIDQNQMTQTDKNGYFKVQTITGFSIDPIIRITKPTYKPFEIKFGSSGESKVYEVRSSLEFIKYDEPLYPNPHDKTGFVTGTWTNEYSSQFAFKADSNLFYLDTIDLKAEIRKVKDQFRKK